MKLPSKKKIRRIRRRKLIKNIKWLEKKIYNEAKHGGSFFYCIKRTAGRFRVYEEALETESRFLSFTNKKLTIDPESRLYIEWK